MNLLPYKACSKSLDFSPNTPWPDNWPAFSWEQYIVAGFNTKQQNSLNFSSKDLHFLDLFYSCYPQLSCLELAKILSYWKDKNIKECKMVGRPEEKLMLTHWKDKNIKDLDFSFLGFSWEEFFSLYQLNYTETFTQIMKMLLFTPPEFQSWLHQKKVQPGELRILNSLKNIHQIHFILLWIADQNPSHRIGLNILEIGTELYLMGFKPEEILKPDTNPETALQTMKKKRHPISSSQDQIKKEKLQQINWPLNTTAQWSRKGDKTGIEIKIWCQNQTEWTEKVTQLNNLPIF